MENKGRFQARLALRESNLHPPDGCSPSTLDSSIKRISALIEKLGRISQEKEQGLMDDLQSVDLSGHVRNAASAICNAELKTSDIQAVVQICSLLHQKYDKFSVILIKELKSFFSKGSATDSKKCSVLLLLMELYFVGVVIDINILFVVITALKKEEHSTHLSLLAAFAGEGQIFLGLPVDEEFSKALKITSKQMNFFRKAFRTFYEDAFELLWPKHPGRSKARRLAYNEGFREGLLMLSTALDMPAPPNEPVAQCLMYGRSERRMSLESIKHHLLWEDDLRWSFFLIKRK